VAYIVALHGRSARAALISAFGDFPVSNQPAYPLMPHATASWLVDNTALTFEQIAEFCGLHLLEVQAMATIWLARSTPAAIRALGRTDPGRDRARQANAEYRLRMQKAPLSVSRTKGPRYTPVSKRQDKPDGIAWILRHHPEISDAQIGKLIGTTRNTIAAIRDRSHWNIQNINPKDPVTLGLCSQRELDGLVAKAAKRAGITEEDAGGDNRLGSDRDALIEELRAEREAQHKAAVEAAQEAEARAWLEARRAEGVSDS
jgi:hypothetical protein